MGVENDYGNISNVFVRLIGYLNLILHFETYYEDYKEYSEILNVINIWAVKYEKQRNLKFINNHDLVNIYEKADVLQTKMSSRDERGNFVNDKGVTKVLKRTIK